MSEKTDKIKQLVPIHEYAEYMGFHVIKKGNYYTLEEHDSVIINPVTNRFFRNSRTEEYSKGSVINFVMYFGEMDYKSAIKELMMYIGNDRFKNTTLIKPVMREKPQKQMLLLPPHSGSRRRVYAYLNKVRKIDIFIIDYFYKANLLYEDNNHNCVFVSYDKNGKPDFACKRGTLSDVPFKGDIPGSNYDYCFCLPEPPKLDGVGKRLYVCEAVIDIMSLMTHFLQSGWSKMDLGSCHYQALSSTQKYMAIFRYLELHPEVEEVYLALDNDKSGRECVNTIIQTGKEKNIKQKLIPFLPEGEGMDWNDVITK